MPKKILKSFCAIQLIAILLSSCAPIKAGLKKITSDDRPNFLIIVTDDQRYDTMQYMPETQKWIFDQGVTFSQGYITTPLCCPSRVSILTGEYAHDTKVRNNGDKNLNRTFIDDLHEHGYYTGLVGKYLNSWKGEARPEYDYWVSYFKGESDYSNPRLNVNGKWRKHLGYITDILGTYSMDFISEANAQKKPWILFYAPIAPHEPTEPYVGDLNLYPDMEPHRPPSFNEADVSDKPGWLKDRPPLNEQEIQNVDDFRRKQILTLVSLDRAISELIRQINRIGELDKTVVIFISDNGKFWGEHRITSKNSFYEEAIRVPFALRYPPLVSKPYIENHLVANIDIAPTVYELAKVAPPTAIDGLSLVRLFDGSDGWREDLLIEGWPPRGIFAALHTGQYVYAETEGDISELYDLSADPYELENLIDKDQYQNLIRGFQIQLHEIKEPPGVPTPIPE